MNSPPLNLLNNLVDVQGGSSYSSTDVVSPPVGSYYSDLSGSAVPSSSDQCCVLLLSLGI